MTDENEDKSGLTLLERILDYFTPDRKNVYNQHTGEYEENPDAHTTEHDYMGY
jgi:hypothetical protein